MGWTTEDCRPKGSYHNMYVSTQVSDSLGLGALWVAYGEETEVVGSGTIIFLVSLLVISPK